MFRTRTPTMKIPVFNVIIEKVLVSKSFKLIENSSISFDVVIKRILNESLSGIILL